VQYSRVSLAEVLCCYSTHTKIRWDNMNTPTKRRIAKELLAFLGCFLLGIVVIPLIISFFDADTTYKDILDSFFVNPQLGAWFVAVSPYTFYLLMKSIV
jgi:acyl-CoA synthetase (AMP-forming)/AMP-acid ligase II